MKLERTFFREGTSRSLRFGGTAEHDQDQYLPPRVADVSRDALKGFPHTKRVGNYLLGRTLGEGSFAKVKEGLHILTGERVAVKCIDKKKAKEDAYVRKNMRREGKLLQIVRHRHVIKLYEIMETENSYYLVTELCRGGDLMDYICNKKKLEEKETRRFIKEIVSAMRYLHTAGILHRDLKVENLLLDENKDIKIIDFGLSNAVRMNQTREGCVNQEFCVTQCGSPAYAAPELLGNKKYGPKVDIWSIGVNMYAMLTGNLPFTVEPFNIKALHQKMLNGNMNPIPETLSKNGRDFLKKLLIPEPDQRMTLEEAMLHPWVADSKNKPMEPAPFPNKLNADDLDNNILKHMSHHLDYRLSDVIRLVTSNIPSNATSTYHMFRQKLNRYNAEMRVQGKVAAAEAQLISTSRSTQNTSGYVSRDDVIDLVPISTGMVVRDVTAAKQPSVDVTDGSDGKIETTKTPPTDKVTAAPSLDPESSPVRLLHRKTHNTRSLQKHDKPHHSAMATLHSNSEQDKHVTEEPANEHQRPATTREKSNISEDVKLFHVPKANDGTPAWGSTTVKKTTTRETRVSSSDSVTDRSKFSHIQTDLPSIAEKPSSSGCVTPRTPPKTKTPSSPKRRPVREAKQTGNYSFRPRGAFTNNKLAELNVHSKNSQINGTTARNMGHVGVNGDHRAGFPESTGQELTSELPGSISESISKKERSVVPRYGLGTGRARTTNDIKVTPRRVLIDVEHYEHFARKNGRVLPVALSANNNTLVQSHDKRDTHTQRLVSLVYPTHNKPSRQGSRNMHTFQRNNQTDKSLNITGERTGVNGSRSSNPVRYTEIENKYSPSSPDGTMSRLPQSLDVTVSNKIDNDDVNRLCMTARDTRVQTSDENGGVELPVIPAVLSPKTAH